MLFVNIGQEIKQEVVTAVAEVKGVDQLELECQLQEHIDMDTLGQLANHETAIWSLSFELPEHNVTVTSNGLVLVDGRETQNWAEPSSNKVSR